MYDIAIIGGGAAGLTAALYALRANKTVLVVEKASFGGQITYSPLVENFPTRASMSGAELADSLTEQVLALGAEVEVDNIVKIENSELCKTLVGEYGRYEAKAVIIATGAKHRMLGLERENDFVGEGISFCAVCDGAFYKDKHVAVIGGGNSALQEALLLSKLCSKVTVVQNLERLTGEDKLIAQVNEAANISVIYEATVKELVGDSSLSAIVLNTKDGEQTLEIDGMFIAIGLIPQNEAFSDLINLDSYGYADSDESCNTKTEGIYVAGDCRKKSVRQLTTACADGSVAALAACRYLDSLK